MLLSPPGKECGVRLGRSSNWKRRERPVFFPVQDLFTDAEMETQTAVAAAPLASRIRPRSLEEFVGQEHILAPGKLLRRAIEADRLSSVILFGPPGTGKTTLAQIIAAMTQSKFERLSGVESNVAEMRRVVAAAANRLRTSGQRTILFVDEIHHFNKAQQDILLPDVERGNLRLIGATTYNPFFYINSPLVSRSQVFQLEPLRRGGPRAIDRAGARGRRARPRRTSREDGFRSAAASRHAERRRRPQMSERARNRRPDTPPEKRAVIHFTLAVAEESIQTEGRGL